MTKKIRILADRPNDVGGIGCEMNLSSYDIAVITEREQNPVLNVILDWILEGHELKLYAKLLEDNV